MGLKRRPKAKLETVVTRFNEWSGCSPLNQGQVDATELALNISIPQEVQELLLRYNGGRPTRTYFSDAKVEVELGRVLEMGASGAYETTHRAWATHCALPVKVVPFAYDSGNANLLCVDTETGEVVYWVHDSEPRRMEIASSLKEFLSRLEMPPY